MAFVYILQSDKNGNYYIGCTNNVYKRFAQHKAGGVKSTKNLLPLRLMLKQEYDDLDTARIVERRLKKLKRKDYINKILADGKITILDE